MSFVSSAMHLEIFMSIYEAKDLNRVCMAGRGQDPSSLFSAVPRILKLSSFYLRSVNCHSPYDLEFLTLRGMRVT